MQFFFVVLLPPIIFFSGYNCKRRIFFRWFSAIASFALFGTLISTLIVGGVIKAFGAAKPHCAYVFANKRANRMKILICDGFGVWLLARRLHRGRFVWSALRSGEPVALDELQLQALASGLPWQYAGADFVIDRQ